MIPAFTKVPCTLGGTHNDTMTPPEIDYIDMGVVVNGIYFKDFPALNEVKEMCKEEGYNTTICVCEEWTPMFIVCTTTVFAN